MFDALCFVYTCRRLIDLSLIAGTYYERYNETSGEIETGLAWDTMQEVAGAVETECYEGRHLAILLSAMLAICFFQWPVPTPGNMYRNRIATICPWFGSTFPVRIPRSRYRSSSVLSRTLRPTLSVTS